MNEIFELLKIVLPSAAISAVVSSLLDTAKERRKEKKTAAHTLLRIAEDLERFAENCKDSLNDYSNGFDQAYDFNDNKKLENIEPPMLEFNPSINWEDLPAKGVNSIKSIQKQYEECEKWIHEKWLDGDYSILEVSDLNMQRIAYYGLIADEKAKEIRKKISSPIESISDRNELFRRIASKSTESRALNNVIPEFKNMKK